MKQATPLHTFSIGPPNHPLIAVVGPTGSGKSELALAIAERFHGEVVNCDSIQVYRGFDIGSAKLSVAERRGIPHHLIDIVEPEALFTAGDYGRIGRETLREIAAPRAVPIVVGGTGFYLRALLDGLSESPSRDDSMRARLEGRERKRKGSLHRILSRLDPDAARTIHVNDLNKTMRALELRLLRNAPRGTLSPPGALIGFSVLIIGLDPDRQALHARLNARLSSMFARGLVEEVSDLLARGVSPQAKPFESLGYKEALSLVQGKLTREEALAAAQLATRQYAKRQLTWFRRDARIRWYHGFGDDRQLQQEVSQWSEESLFQSRPVLWPPLPR